MLITGDWLTPTGTGRTLFHQTTVEVLADSIVFPFLWDFRMGNTVLVGGGGSSMCFFTVLLAKELFGEKEALWSGFSLTTCFHFMYEHCAKTGEMDAIQLFFLISSLYFFDSQREKSTPVTILLFFFWFFLL